MVESPVEGEGVYEDKQSRSAWLRIAFNFASRYVISKQSLHLWHGSFSGR